LKRSVPIEQQLVELDRLDAPESLAKFITLAWPVLEPQTPRRWGWALDVVCEHLEAVGRGELNRLLVNCPPGMAKSLITGVFFPAWLWGPKNRPGTRIIGSSYSEDYATRDNRRMRDLVSSPWYQERWGDRVRLLKVGETSFSNTATGFRQGVPFPRLTGGRADLLILDDPHSASSAESDAERERTVRLFRESVTTRLNDPERTAIVVIMQRLHERDIAGVILAEGLGYERLILPMEFEPGRRCSTGVVWRRTGEPFEDPRERDGDLLFPERFPAEVVARDKVALGSYAVASQFQQRPAPRGGGMLKVENMPVVDDWPRDAALVRRWDLAATEATGRNDPDYVAGALLAYKDGRAWLVDMRRDRLSPYGVERLVRVTAEADAAEHGAVPVVIEQEGGSGGKITIDHYRRKVLEGFAVYADSPAGRGSKVQRADPFVAAAEAGNVSLVRGAWVADFLDECRTFPMGAHDDQVDAASAAFVWLARRTRWEAQDTAGPVGVAAPADYGGWGQGSGGITVLG
jgi:predicted phage terminase large subunit-like protein